MAILSEVPFTLPGCKFGSVTIDKALPRAGVAGGKKGGIVCFHAAIIVVNVTAVKLKSTKHKVPVKKKVK